MRSICHRRRRRGSPVILAVLLLLAISACASTRGKSPQNTSVGTAGHGLFPSANAAQTIDYGNGLVSAPAPSGDHPRISAAAARKLADSAGPIKNRDNSVETALRVITFDASQGKGVPSGLTAKRVGPILAWIVAFPNTPALVGGPVGLGSSTRSSIAASLHCISFVVVDATTGEKIDNEQLCRGN